MHDYRTIIVDATPRRRLRDTLAFAHDMARTFNTGVVAASYAWPRLSAGDVLVHNALLDQERTVLMKRELAAGRRVFDEVFAADPALAEWHSDIGEPTVALGSHALTADLLVTGPGEEERCLVANPAHVAIAVGIPVLRLGTTAPPGGFARALVAWKDCPQAYRAVHGALPFLMRAERAEVVGVGDDVAMQRLEEVAAHLRCHAVKADPCHLPHTAGSAHASLIEKARRDGATLFVSGAYSRRPLAERVFGGVTASMLANADVCWLMSN
jgi:nucleotide-binding universal stress UspA family protein